MIHKEIGYNSGGTYVEFFDDERERVAYFYGNIATCHALKNSICLPPNLEWINAGSSCLDPFDLDCERRFD